MKKIGNKLFKNTDSSRPTKFTKPLHYSAVSFGIKGEVVTSYCLDINVSEMNDNFKVFEEMPNVHDWPISKLIQRELDIGRASMICRDYLLSDGYVKYFPPLTAVLIPTANDHLPEDLYPSPYEGELESIRKYIKIERGEYDGDNYIHENSIISGGIYLANSKDDPSNGVIFWDNNIVSAVIIDGQHRFKSLLEAMKGNKDFQECRLVVNIIDLVDVCKRVKKGPTSVARDLFVSINNTPVEVDEARLILMDDRDTLATFTQVLVDDSLKNCDPSIKPELVDWKCDQGKHDISTSMSGVLTLRGVIGAAMFDDKSIASVDARSNKKLVKQWLGSLDKWIDPDPYIEEEIAKHERLDNRFNLACASNATEDDDDSAQPFLFSYSAGAALVIKNRFRELYLDVFREVFNELIPYSEVISAARENGAFEKNKPLHRYLRAFSAQRSDLIDTDNEINQAVSSYRNKLKALNENHILMTVMGQKALFKALFKVYLSDASIDKVALLEQARQFVKDFNRIYELLQVSGSFDESFFNVKFRLKKGVLTKEAGDLGKEYWRGIILNHSGEIDYGKTAVDILKDILKDILEYETGSSFEFNEAVRSKIISRHKTILKKYNSDIEDERAQSMANKIVSAKEKYIADILAS